MGPFNCSVTSIKSKGFMLKRDLGVSQETVSATYEEIICSIPACVSAVNCTGKANGVFEKGCRSYAICTDGNSNIVECAIGQVFNNNTKMCDE